MMDAVQHGFTKRLYLAWRWVEGRLQGTRLELPFTLCGIHWIYGTEIKFVPKRARDAEFMYSGRPRRPQAFGSDMRRVRSEDAEGSAPGIGGQGMGRHSRRS